MKRILLIASVFFISVVLNSCSSVEDDRYYVKYEANDSIHYLGKVIVNTENGIREFTVNNISFSQIFGPVKKGFIATVTAYNATTVSIYVCKGEEPFVLKHAGSTRGYYVIDF